MRCGVNLQLYRKSLFILPNSAETLHKIPNEVGIRDKTVKVFIPFSRLQLMRTAMKKERCV